MRGRGEGGEVGEGALSTLIVGRLGFFGFLVISKVEERVVVVYCDANGLGNDGELGYGRLAEAR